MDFNKITVIAAMKKRLAWLSERQEVLAENIANSDTPDRKARDLQAFDFNRLVRREFLRVGMDMTNPSHLAPRRTRSRDFIEEESRRSYETAPAGNAIIIEEQMLKLSKTGADHKLMTELYKKHLAMFRMAIGGR